MSNTEYLAVKSGMFQGRNALQNALTRANQARGTWKTGTSLNTSKLVKTLVSVMSGKVNDDRFKRSFIEPEVTASLAVMIDISGSMDGSIGRRKPSKLQDMTLSAYALAEVLSRIGVEVNVGYADYEARPDGQGYRPVIYNLIEGGKPLVPLADALRIGCLGGTDMISYAWAAVETAEASSAYYRLAVYMTDGCCSSAPYLRSVAEQAARSGITLMGVVYATEREIPTIAEHPNGVRVTDPSAFGKVVMNRLAAAVNAGGKVCEGEG
jgi:hypothetical protein